MPTNIPVQPALENYTFLTERVEIKRSNLYGVSAGAILESFLTPLLHRGGRVIYDEKLLRLAPLFIASFIASSDPPERASTHLRALCVILHC